MNLAVKIYKTYGSNTLSLINDNPYKLVEDVDGVGFVTADRIAHEVGIQPDSEFRIRAGIVYCLKQAAATTDIPIFQKNICLTWFSSCLD